MQRRQFLQSAATAFTVPVFLNGLNLSALTRPFMLEPSDEAEGRVLVLVQLNGGNDGLNMIIPRDQYRALSQARPKLMIPEQKVLPLTDLAGLHPAMAGLHTMYGEGQMGVVQSVGYPNQNRSHFRSTEIWATGSPSGEAWRTGWMGRYLDDRHPGWPWDYPSGDEPDPFAITMGFAVSQTCQGEAFNVSIALNNPFSLTQFPEPIGELVTGTRYGDELAFIRLMIAHSNAYTKQIYAAAKLGTNAADYPETRLAEQLKKVALLISGGLRTKVYVVSISGFDTHANQVDGSDPTAGNHANLLKTVSEALHAFQQDLNGQGLQDRVIGMTFSEFGRQIRANDSLGTDHGTAAPLLLFGACVNAQVLGDNPDIAEQVQVQEGVPMQNDFRDVYGSLLMDWFGVSIHQVRSFLYPEFRYLPLIGECRLTSVDHPGEPEAVQTSCFPNPFRDITNIQFTTNREWVRLSIVDRLGREVSILLDRQLEAGEHQVAFDGRGLPAGAYFYRLLLRDRQATKRIVKVE